MTKSWLKKKKKHRTAIYKTRNTGTGNGMQVMQGMLGMFDRIPRNPLEVSGECYQFNILRNIRKDFGERY